MIEFPWPLFGLGVSAGAAIGALYFTGLAAGIRLALRSTHTAMVLLGSAALRIMLLLAIGFAIAPLGAAALGGFALGFLIVRLVVVAAATPRAVERSGPWS